MRKKVDSRVRTLVENCVAQRQRSLFVIVGDNARDQVVNLHYMLSKTVVKARPSVLWCYKKDLYLSSHRKKRMRQIKKMMQRGLMDPEQEDPFTLFVASTNIRYCFYAETQKILGNTYGMCVLQDFEALTPNLLARTIETVEGGGIVVMLLSSMQSLSQLYQLTMDVHSRMRTDAHQDVTGRFNERLVLSLASNPHCIIMDDELNILPISSQVKDILPIQNEAGASGAQGPAKELKELVESLTDTVPAGQLVDKCRTLDQARAVMTFLDAASEKSLRSTVALTAARGRGKSASLGLAIAGAIMLGYSNIFVTAPSPENLRTLFEFIFKGLDSLGYKEHLDYDLVESTNPAFNKAVVRVNVFRSHRQTVQYMQPQHHEKLAQAELLVIDEAAAIPLPVVKSLLGPYLVFLCSTVNGYEGTGRSLSLKLIHQLRSEGAKLASSKNEGSEGRSFREVQLQEPIRYSSGDAVEAWLHELLCLNAAEHLPSPPPRLPHPEECELYIVERDTLFSYHKASEAFLQRAMALLVASHYRNTPNDLLFLSDAPAHRLFVLTGPVDEAQNALPDILCVVQVALEGAISKQAALHSLARGVLPAGDMIPWTVGQQFQDAEFPHLSGARIVRIAVHPDLSRAGYGTRAVNLLRQYYQGEFGSLDPNEEQDTDGQQGCDRTNGSASTASGEGTLLSETLRPRSNLPPLLRSLSEKAPEQLQWLGVSYGLTQQLYNFWKRSQFEPVYLRQSPSDITGEHTAIMISPLRSEGVEGTQWLDPFLKDFKLRFMTLLAGPFRSFAPALALSILNPKLNFSEAELQAAVEKAEAVLNAAGEPFSAYDIKRLEAYSNNLVDYHMILDLIPPITRTYFCGRIPTSLSYGQAAIFLCLGLQQVDVTAIEGALSLPSNQVLALFNKAVRKLHQHLQACREARVDKTLPKPTARQLQPHAVDLDKDLEEGAKEVQEAMRAALDPEKLAQYSVAGAEADFEGALGGRLPASGLVSLKKDAKDKEHTPQLYKKSEGKKRQKGSTGKGKPSKRSKN